MFTIARPPPRTRPVAPWFVLVAISLAATLALPAVSNAAERATTLRYGVSHLGRELGVLKMTLPSARSGVKRVVVKGKLTVPGSSLTVTFDSQSHMDLASGYARKQNWRFAVFGAPRSARGTIERDDRAGKAGSTPRWRLNAELKHDDAVEARVKADRPGDISDIVTFGSWLARQAATTDLRTHVYGGYFLYDVFGRHAGRETVALPAGPRMADRWELRATRPGRTRVVTLWTDPEALIPLKASVDLDYFGSIEIALLSVN
ncbi:MAG: hypothetical protein IV100_19985 [Myxococcales bacterium]|nr:hypothetical protein [Myxococcales bacterium]